MRRWCMKREAGLRHGEQPGILSLFRRKAEHLEFLSHLLPKSRPSLLRRLQPKLRPSSLHRLPALLLIPALLLLGPAGCWDRQELNELGIISATGVDLTDTGRWEVSYQLVIPNAISAQGAYVGGSSSPVNVFTSVGDSFRGAVSRTTQEMSRRVYFSHNQVVVISEEAARRGINNLMEAYMRNGDSRETVTVLVTEGSARTILEQLLPMERISGVGINRLITLEEKYGGNFRQISMFEMMQDLLSPVHITAVPGIGLSGSGAAVDTVDAAKTTHTGAKVRLQKVAIFKNNKLAGWLSTHENRGLLWVTNRVKGSTVSFPCQGERQKLNSIRLKKQKTRVTPVRKGSGWLMKIESKATGVLMEYNCPGSMRKPQDLLPVEASIEAELKRDMEDGILAAQRLKADAAGFGNLLHLKHKEEWKQIESDWNERGFPKVEIEISVHVKLAKTGRSIESYNEAFEKSRKKE
ncbi:hypothetical protein CGZ75_04175 [Paenibacillus herberti]|uniref:Uncharacterized protein n=2 Tax=Paenibacillus herberti TaxID=1619309 RepID=A0A229P1Z7_9BACL|nr:hypothetical protein CGZ75_04175 [Paenibacillus herberti]